MDLQNDLLYFFWFRKKFRPETYTVESVETEQVTFRNNILFHHKLHDHKTLTPSYYGSETHIHRAGGKFIPCTSYIVFASSNDVTRVVCEENKQVSSVYTELYE